MSIDPKSAVSHVLHLPPNPSLEHQKKLAKSLLRDLSGGDVAAARRFRAGVHRLASPDEGAIFRAKVTLADAQHVLAREYGFPSWPRLKAHIEAIRKSGKPGVAPPKVLALLKAVEASQVDAVERILAAEPALANAVFFERHIKGQTFLHAVALSASKPETDEQVLIAEALIRRGADVNVRGNDWAQTPLMLCAWRGRARLAAVLVEHGADPNIASSYGRSPIEQAAIHRYPDIVRQLIRAGARAKLRHLIMAGMHTELAAALGADPRRVGESDADAENENTAFGLPLHVAISNPAAPHGNERAFDLLLERGADVNALDRAGHTPLQIAAQAKNERAIKILMGRGATADIHTLVILGDGEAAAALLRRDPTAANARLAGGMTPLIRACSREDDTIARLLLAHGAEVNVAVHRFIEATTPLIAAIASNNEALVRALLERGADPNFAHETYPPLVEAVRKSPAMTRLLLDHRADPNLMSDDDSNRWLNACPLAWVAHWGQEENVRLLLAAGADLADERNASALFHAAEKGWPAIIEMLAAHGVDINYRDGVGYTALERAQAAGKTECVEALRRLGAR